MCFSRSLLTRERREMGQKLEGEGEGGEHLGIGIICENFQD